VQPSGLSSLIFVVIIGVWAAYFIQYWVRRREHLATARSVDQFSESMRVLERRTPVPTATVGDQGGGSYAATPARAARPQLIVRRTTATATETGGAAGAPVTTESAVPSRPSAPARDASPLAARRTRGLVMVGSFSTAVVAVPLVALSMLPLLALVVPVVSVGGSLAWVRRSVRAEQRSRRAARPTPGATQQPVGRAQAPAAPRVAAGPAAGIEAVEVAAEATVEAAATQAPAPAPRNQPYDVLAVESAQVAAASTVHQAALAAQPVATVPLVDEDDIPLTWDPVPVPRPTYTMKARVTRPAPTSADLVGDADTEYAAHEDALPARRAVAGA
jgi:hypothetical protein